MIYFQPFTTFRYENLKNSDLNISLIKRSIPIDLFRIPYSPDF